MYKSLFLSFTLLFPLFWVNTIFSSQNDFFWELPIPMQGAMPDLHNSPIFDLQAENCGYCHKEIYKQWSSSLHAKAMGPGLLGQLAAFDEEMVTECLNCHAPRREQQNQWKSNSASKIRGVDCSSCHVRKHLRFGAKNKPLSPHGEVKKLSLFSKSEFCSTCHQFDNSGILVNGKPLENTYIEWKNSRYEKEGKQCQDCHIKGNHGFKGIHDKKMTREGLLVEVERKPGAIFLRATNHGAGHALPTYITPKILLRIKSIDSTKQIEHIIQRKMHWSIKKGWQELFDTRLLPDQSITIKLPLPVSESAIIEVIVEPDADYHERVYPFLIKELAELIDNKSLQQLNSARDCSGQSIYVLYSYECPANSNVCNEINL